jgi:hypothetical protein
VRVASFLLALLAAGCGSAGDEPAGNPADTNQIERLATPRVEKADPQASVRLQAITEADVHGEGMAGAGCRFVRDGRMLLASAGSDALIRIAGELRHLIHSAPVGPTGGFFEDRQLSVSVGRDRDAPVAGGSPSGPARITITNRRTEAQIELRGVWTCAS